MKKRLDLALVERGLADSRQKAQALIMAGLVTVDGQLAAKAGMAVASDQTILLREKGSPYVGRGGLKLEGAAEAFDLHVAGAICVDIGASTGGFTQFLLLAGAARVYAVDVDVNQLDWRLRQDERVVPIEKNARFLDPADIGQSADSAPFVDIVTIDASFISLTMLLPRVLAILKPGGQCVALVKPQFEVGKDRVGRGGIVRDDEDQRAAVEKCVRCGESLGMRFIKSVESPIRGREGNREYFILFEKA